ncbi:MAG: glycerol-3-phosphate acyltransferase [Bacteroidales bacterium]|nr:glycerol-3-phosphate acyltransferase [Bacteroidales bacterium]
MNDVLFYLENHPTLTAVICSAAGYLIGSVSSARIVYFLATGKRTIEPFAEPVPHSEETFESDLVSATLVTKKLGAKFGCITSLADMVKVALPTLLAKLILTTEPFFLLVALFGVIGHNLPLWYGFRGGRGESPIIGALLVINWFGLIIANVAAALLGFITGSVLVMRWGAYVILIFWLWYYFNDWRYGLFMILLNFFFWSSMRKDLARFIELKRKRGLEFTEEEVSEFILMGKTPGRFLDKYSLYALMKRVTGKRRPGSR